MTENTVIIKIREAEENAKREKNDAIILSKEQISTAYQNGEILLDNTRKNASEFIKKSKIDNENAASEKLLTEKANALFSADALKKSAKPKIDDAAKFILRRLFDD